jgi:hypothetical protein
MGVLVFGVALVGHAPLVVAFALAAVMVVYGVVVLLGRRSDFIGVLSAPQSDERSWNAHIRASAAAGQVVAAVVIVAFLLDLAHGNFGMTPWVAMGAVFGVTYLVALLFYVRRG